MTVVELLHQARTAGLRVQVAGGRLVVRGPADDEPIARQLLAKKPEITALLAAPAHSVIRPHHCGAGVTPCGAPARPYPCGWRCDNHRPGAPR